MRAKHNQRIEVREKIAEDNVSDVLLPCENGWIYHENGYYRIFDFYALDV